MIFWKQETSLSLRVITLCMLCIDQSILIEIYKSMKWKRLNTFWSHCIFLLVYIPNIPIGSHRFPPSHLQDPGGSVGQDLDWQHPRSGPHLLVDELLLGLWRHQARVRAEHHDCSIIQTPDTTLSLVVVVGGGIWSEGWAIQHRTMWRCEETVGNWVVKGIVHWMVIMIVIVIVHWMANYVSVLPSTGCKV